MSDIRPATNQDLNALLQIERDCFQSDRLSKRSFQRFIKPGSHRLRILEMDGQTIGYALTLFRSGTNLARLYSIALLPEYRGRGFAKQLLSDAESEAADSLCAFIRLEVSESNPAATRLYQSSGYKAIGKIPAYYEDGSTAVRMEKRLHKLGQGFCSNSPYYQQTTEFTCGPASLMMALKELQTDYQLTPSLELALWREATTIFMTSGHGGCSPHGLALSAWKRGFAVKLYVSSSDIPFIDGVRNIHKKEVIELVHADFVRQIAATDIESYDQTLSFEEWKEILARKQPLLALISTWRLNRNKAPHWVYIAASDDRFVYINDPDPDENPLASPADFQCVPIEHQLFWQIARFGQQKLRALIQISKHQQASEKTD
ncbi:GNAT family N-acetyltransferase/peptidase C39 family protein [Thiomicrorhabdus heinhorstiae]|uniref:GNAT family N-acetyltransferase/peptidase C39 family protein n=1 Tax=Thiomicrorhabdus heinhorstiae TaxID=2748010 RepID=A0ABS0BWS2_9GAMM|nr:GNAT family N-acetyltransferase/peptidase C39 family protein [Thiomicrorhabdus heinhorstiae]MBF6057515.1 GNAT family N-acetyltransferase/peptidase C39 family protein [Thiomicrorhabdus heinhorstiae]